MASTTAMATMAAAGFDKRSSGASSLQTPGSGTFPSETRSPLAGSPSWIKKDDLKTPITPPSAYLDFLRNMSPAMMSPASTGTSNRFSFHEKPSEKASSEPAVPAAEKQPIATPMSQPALSRNTSYDSATSTTTTSTDQSAASYSSSGSTVRTKPESPRVIIPPSPFAKPTVPRSASGRTPRRLHIPQSPYSPGMGSANSLRSIHSQPSPYSMSSTPLSAAPWSASFSPRDVDTEINGKPGKVSVRQVVTRTVTYCRTPLEPAPKGKRRKVEETDSRSSEEPPSKQEKTGDADSERRSSEPLVKQETPASSNEVCNAPLPTPKEGEPKATSPTN